MRETWYVLENGNLADPADVGSDEGGALVHKSGVAVAMRGQVPHSRGVDDPAAVRDKIAENARLAAEAAAKSEAKNMKPADQVSGYKTRESKAR